MRDLEYTCNGCDRDRRRSQHGGHMLVNPEGGLTKLCSDCMESNHE